MMGPTARTEKASSKESEAIVTLRLYVKLAKNGAGERESEGRREA